MRSYWREGFEELENPFMSINGDLIREGGGEKATAGRCATAMAPVVFETIKDCRAKRVRTQYPN
jgi:hypothetical protein